jgi:acetyl esterase/lipase
MNLDPQILEALQALPPAEPVPRGDAMGVRASIDAIMAAAASADAPTPRVERRGDTAQSSDGESVPVRLYRRKDSNPGSAVLYLHGGGMVSGTVDLYDTLVAGYVERTGVPFLAVDYRLAPEKSGTALLDDCYAGLEWLLAHAGELGIDPARVAVMGDSAGGGLAAGVAILARDRGVRLARQILVYPMLDDRNVEPNPALAPTATWSYDNNYTGWAAVLGDAIGGPDVPVALAPARLKDAAGLPPAYLEVGGADIFRDEDLQYAAVLARADVDLEFHLHPGAVHAADRLAPTAEVSRRALADRDRVISAL